MKLKISLFLGIFLIFISAGLLFSEEQVKQEEPVVQQEPSRAQTQEAASVPDMQWIWGEVVSVDTNTKQLVVKYLDYEADSEKEAGINVDDKTTYENVKSIEEIKSQDTVSVDYVIDSKGSNIARNISVEKPEGQEALPEENVGVEVKPAP